MNDMEIERGNSFEQELERQDDEVRQQQLEQQREMLNADMKGQQDLLGEYNEVQNAIRQQAAQKVLQLRNSVAVMMKMTDAYGSVGAPLLAKFNRDNGLNEQNGLSSVGYDRKSGDFVMQFADGKAHRLAPIEQFQMATSARGIFNDNDVATRRQALLRSGLSSKEIAKMDMGAAFGGINPDHINARMRGGAGGREVGGGVTFKGPDTRPRGVHSFSSDGKGGFRETHWTPEGGYSERRWGTLDPNYKGVWKVISVGPSDTFNGKDDTTQVRRYENSKTGEVVSVKDGETPPWEEKKPKESGGRGGLSFEERTALEDQRQKGRMDLAKLTGAQRKEVSDAANVLKKYGIDVGLQKTQESNAARMSIAELGAALKERGYEVDEKKLAEAVRHNKAGEEAVAGRGAETARHNKAGEELRGASIGERERHNRAAEELGEQKLAHNKDRLANDKEQREADRQLKLSLAKMKQSLGTSKVTGEKKQSVEKEIQDLQRILDGGNLTPENRAHVKDRLNALAKEIGVDSPEPETPKANVKPGDNRGVETKESAREKLLATGRYELDDNGRVVPKKK